MSFVADNPCVHYHTYGPKSLDKEVEMWDDGSFHDFIELTQYANDPHMVSVRCIDRDDAISVSIHKGTFVQGFYKAIVEMGHKDYLKKLMGIAPKA